MKEIRLQMTDATAAAVEGYGLFIGEEVGAARLPIPFYDHVEEGANIPFEYQDHAVIRTARIHPADKPCIWLEYHDRMRQLFVGLGTADFAIILGKPTTAGPDGERLPDPSSLRCLRFKPGTGMLLEKGTWHDFPRAIDRPVTCLTANSAEVVQALAEMEAPGEMSHGDVHKISLPRRMDLRILVEPARELAHAS